MAQGLLEVTGTIRLDQFWPEGESDADTTKVLVTTTGSSFKFRPHPGTSFEVTRAFQNSKVLGRVVRPPINKKGQILVRLQGIDAPELHYQPEAALPPKKRTREQDRLYLEWNHEYRQHLGETATMNLRRQLNEAGRDPLPCTVVSAVDTPSEVFDTYARFVGDILVRIKGAETDINTWLVRKGWAFPTFYSSMSNEEIENLIAAANAARKKQAGIWPYLTDHVDNLDWDLRYRGKGAKRAQTDIGPVILPKLFRRVAKWAVNRRAKMLSGSFRSYLRELRESCYLMMNFIEQGPTASTPRLLDEFLDKDGFFRLRPEDLVFQEAPSRLVSARGADITSW